MDFIRWLQALGADANPAAPGFQPSVSYLAASVLLPVTIGLIVGFGLRLLERLFGIELGRGGH